MKNPQKICYGGSCLWRERPKGVGLQVHVGYYKSGEELCKMLDQCFPTFFQSWHTFLEQLSRRLTAFLALILYIGLRVYQYGV